MVTSTITFYLFVWITAVVAQSAQMCYGTGRCLETYVDPVNGVKYGFALPLSCDPIHTNELIGQIDAPMAVKWAGISLGGGHNSSPLILAWPHGSSVVHSVREAQNYLMPTPYAGPTITTIKTTFYSGRWQWTFRCQNCLSWNNIGPGGQSGSIDPNSFAIMGWATSTVAVFQPSNPNSGLDQHTEFGMWAHFMNSAHTAYYPVYLLP